MGLSIVLGGMYTPSSAGLMVLLGEFRLAEEVKQDIADAVAAFGYFLQAGSRRSLSEVERAVARLPSGTRLRVADDVSLRPPWDVMADFLLKDVNDLTAIPERGAL